MSETSKDKDLFASASGGYAIGTLVLGVVTLGLAYFVIHLCRQVRVEREKWQKSQVSHSLDLEAANGYVQEENPLERAAEIT